MIEQNLLLVLTVLPFAGALLAVSLGTHARNAEAWLAAIVMAAGLVITLSLYPLIQDGGALRSQIQWVPSIGLNLLFRLDGFSWMFLLLVFGIGLMVVIYARFYLSPKDPSARFFGSLLAFTGAMAGVLLSGNVIMLVVFWELTSITSFLLISYWHHLQGARDGARMSLIVTGLGGLCLLAAMLIIGHVVGSYDIDRILAAGGVIKDHGLYPVILALFLLGTFTKSAQFPFHFWLPNAMNAPTPVSSYLHSATMVKAGVYLMVRFAPSIGGTDLWFYAVGGVGMVTMAFGAFVALFRHDLKGLLAYSTISHLGLITALAGFGTPAAIVAAIFHIANHAIFKASLFMAAGIVDHEAGTRDMRRLSGLRRLMPVTFVLTALAAAAMAGVPLLSGFISKEMFLAETIEPYNGSQFAALLPWVATIGSLFSAAYALRLILSVFFGPDATSLPKTPHEPPRLMRLPVEILVLLAVAVGCFPYQTIAPILKVAVLSVLGDATPHYSLSLWHGFNTPLMMSAIALIGGTLLYLTFRRQIEEGPDGPPLIHPLRGQRVFDRLLLILSWRVPRRLLSTFASDRLQSQLVIIILVAFLVAAWSVWGVPRPVPDILGGVGFDLPFAMLWIVGATCAVAAAWQAKYHRFAALVLLGGAGLCTVMTFALLSAPDLAVTQLLVEIVTTVLLLLGLRWLPKRREPIKGDGALRSHLRRTRDLVIAVACGGGVAIVALWVMLSPPVDTIGDWFLQNAYSEGGGTNVVNVILVDFRAFDTFGEITVLAIVGLTVFSLLRRFRPAPEAAGRPDEQIGADPKMLDQFLYVPAIVMQWMFAPTIALSAYLFFRGHDLPGGGFAAGVTLAVGFLMQYIAANVRWIESRLTVLPIRWIGWGLLIAAATGMGAWLFGYPFLTAHSQYLDIPIIGRVPAASALFFDLGVFLLVVGATVLMLIAIAHQSLRSARARELDEARAKEEDEEVA
ncbi:monovalent cation/H+ antiporter subunit A [Ketogulonicigenium vulgare]|uniref:NADH dehydrogenase (Quinone) n=1 Tax=Ketogulonicigenium vulgare (strain WSH-001) TaxID=759362 RepID=F9Y395_KETVW|nr:monovalent cation/H+ antiporter subunit A [Ketogulonicigenium vulgare]AEM40336.1 NADH dehydrogenase (Quinone) [Ketogulonicigenium vulgare WSH-001]ALJ80531.1 cation:proton antiporter [Ketogulonicigenium vulgare]